MFRLVPLDRSPTSKYASHAHLAAAHALMIRLARDARMVF